MATSTRKRGRPCMLSDSERKRKKNEADHHRNRAKIYIGDAIDRWNTLKEEKAFLHHYEVARFLLKCYIEMHSLTAADPPPPPAHEPTCTCRTLTCSTPKPLPGPDRQNSFQGEMSENSAEMSTGQERSLSPEHAVPVHNGTADGLSHLVPTESTSHRSEKLHLPKVAQADVSDINIKSEPCDSGFEIAENAEYNPNITVSDLPEDCSQEDLETKPIPVHLYRNTSYPLSYVESVQTQPEIVKIDTQQNSLKQPDIGNVNTQQSSVTQPYIGNVNTQQSSVTQPYIGNVNTQQTSVTQPYIGNVNTQQSSVTQPYINNVNTQQSSVTQPYIGNVNTQQSSVTQPYIGNVNTQQSSVTQPDIASMNTQQNLITQPDIANLYTQQSLFTQLNFANRLTQQCLLTQLDVANRLTQESSQIDISTNTPKQCSPTQAEVGTGSTQQKLLAQLKNANKLTEKCLLTHLNIANRFTQQILPAQLDSVNRSMEQGLPLVLLSPPNSQSCVVPSNLNTSTALQVDKLASTSTKECSTSDSNKRHYLSSTGKKVWYTPTHKQIPAKNSIPKTKCATKTYLLVPCTESSSISTNNKCQTSHVLPSQQTVSLTSASSKMLNLANPITQPNLPTLPNIASKSTQQRLPTPPNISNKAAQQSLQEHFTLANKAAQQSLRTHLIVANNNTPQSLPTQPIIANNNMSQSLPTQLIIANNNMPQRLQTKLILANQTSQQSLPTHPIIANKPLQQSLPTHPIIASQTSQNSLSTHPIIANKPLQKSLQTQPNIANSSQQILPIQLNNASKNIQQSLPLLLYVAPDGKQFLMAPSRLNSNSAPETDMKTKVSTKEYLPMHSSGKREDLTCFNVSSKHLTTGGNMLCSNLVTDEKLMTCKSDASTTEQKGQMPSVNLHQGDSVCKSSIQSSHTVLDDIKEEGDIQLNENPTESKREDIDIHLTGVKDCNKEVYDKCAGSDKNSPASELSSLTDTNTQSEAMEDNSASELSSLTDTNTQSEAMEDNSANEISTLTDNNTQSEAMEDNSASELSLDKPNLYNDCVNIKMECDGSDHAW